MKYLNIGGFHILTKRNIHINIIDKFLVNSIVFTLLVRKILKSKTLADKINLEKNVS
jgi:hypothetical protein